MIYTSSFFGDELWPSDKLGFTRSALANAPSPVSIFFSVQTAASAVGAARWQPWPMHSALARQATVRQRLHGTWEHQALWTPDPSQRWLRPVFTRLIVTIRSGLTAACATAQLPRPAQ